MSRRYTTPIHDDRRRIDGGSLGGPFGGTDIGLAVGVIKRTDSDSVHDDRVTLKGWMIYTPKISVKLSLDRFSVEETRRHLTSNDSH